MPEKTFPAPTVANGDALEKRLNDAGHDVTVALHKGSIVIASPEVFDEAAVAQIVSTHDGKPLVPQDPVEQRRNELAWKSSLTQEEVVELLQLLARRAG